MDMSYIIKLKSISDHKFSASSQMPFNLFKKKKKGGWGGVGWGRCYTLLQFVVVVWFVLPEGQLLTGCKRQTNPNAKQAFNKSNLYWNIETNDTQSTLCIETNVTQSTVSIYADCCLKPNIQEASLQFTRCKRSKSNLF